VKVVVEKSTLLKNYLRPFSNHKKGDIFGARKQVLGPDYNLVPGESYMKYLSQVLIYAFTTVAEM